MAGAMVGTTGEVEVPHRVIKGKGEFHVALIVNVVGTYWQT